MKSSSAESCEVAKSLAEARLRRQAKKDLGVSNVTVTVTAGK